MPSAVQLYLSHTLDELQEQRQQIRSDQANRASGGFYLYTQDARIRLERIAWAITYHLMDRKKQDA